MNITHSFVVGGQWAKIFVLLALTNGVVLSVAQGEDRPIPSVSVSFAEGSAGLTDLAKDSIRVMVRQATQAEPFVALKIVSWSDRPYPSDADPGLSTTQVSLAERRNDQIREFIRGEFPTLRVSTHNMAKRPNILQDMLDSPDVRIKRTMEGQDADAVSKSVVLVVPTSGATPRAIWPAERPGPY